MKKISFWARDHKVASRIFIVTSYFIAGALAVITGIFLNDLGFNFSSVVFYCLAAAFLGTFLLYPFKQKKVYAMQKSFDIFLLVVSFSLCVFVANRPAYLLNGIIPVNASTLSLPSHPKDSVRTYKPIVAFMASMKDENGNKLKWKERRKLLKEQIRGIKKSNDLSRGDKTLLIILSIVVALGLLMLVAAASCDLACSGSGGASVLVLIGGIAAIILLFILAIRGIEGRNRKKKKMDAPKSTGP